MRVAAGLEKEEYDRLHSPLSNLFKTKNENLSTWSAQEPRTNTSWLRQKEKGCAFLINR